MGASDAKGQGSANSDDRLANSCDSGPAVGLHVRCVDVCPETDGLENSVRAIDYLRPRSGLSSNDGEGSNLTPARSDGLDNVDGGPDAAFYIQMGVIEQVSIFGRF